MYIILLNTDEGNTKFNIIYFNFILLVVQDYVCVILRSSYSMVVVYSRGHEDLGFSFWPKISP